MVLPTLSTGVSEVSRTHVVYMPGYAPSKCDPADLSTDYVNYINQFGMTSGIVA